MGEGICDLQSSNLVPGASTPLNPSQSSAATASAADANLPDDLFDLVQKRDNKCTGGAVLRDGETRETGDCAATTNVRNSCPQGQRKENFKSPSDFAERFNSPRYKLDMESSGSKQLGAGRYETETSPHHLLPQTNHSPQVISQLTSPRLELKHGVEEEFEPSIRKEFDGMFSVNQIDTGSFKHSFPEEKTGPGVGTLVGGHVSEPNLTSQYVEEGDQTDKPCNFLSDSPKIAEFQHCKQVTPLGVVPAISKVGTREISHCSAERRCKPSQRQAAYHYACHLAKEPALEQVEYILNNEEHLMVDFSKLEGHRNEFSGPSETFLTSNRALPSQTASFPREINQSRKKPAALMPFQSVENSGTVEFSSIQHLLATRPALLHANRKAICWMFFKDVGVRRRLRVRNSGLSHGKSGRKARRSASITKVFENRETMDCATEDPCAGHGSMQQGRYEQELLFACRLCRADITDSAMWESIGGTRNGLVRYTSTTGTSAMRTHVLNVHPNEYSAVERFINLSVSERKGSCAVLELPGPSKSSSTVANCENLASLEPSVCVQTENHGEEKQTKRVDIEGDRHKFTTNNDAYCPQRSLAVFPLIRTKSSDESDSGEPAKSLHEKCSQGLPLSYPAGTPTSSNFRTQGSFELVDHARCNVEEACVRNAHNCQIPNVRPGTLDGIHAELEGLRDILKHVSSSVRHINFRVRQMKDQS